MWGERREELKKKLVMIVSLIILTPIVLAVCISTPIFVNVAGGVNWLGFWGSYLGAVLGGGITVIVFWGTIEENKSRDRREEKRHLFEILISDAAHIGELQERLSSTPCNCSTHDDLVYELNTKVLEVKMRLELAGQKGIYTNTSQPIKLLDDMMDQVKKIQKLQVEILDDKNKVKREIDDLCTSLCKMGFIFQIKQFIMDNDR